MAKQTTDESFQALQHLDGPDPLDRVYLFYGEDAFMLEKLVEAVERKRFKGKPVDPLSWEVYRATETGVQRALDSVRTISMFGGAKVVVYRDLDKLPDADLAKLLEYAQKPARAHLILVAEKIDGRKKLWSELKKVCHSVQCAPLTDRNVSDYIRTAARDIPFASGAVDALANCVGPNRAMLERAFEKLRIVMAGAKSITPELVEEHVLDTRERSIFELTRTLTRRDIPAALEALRVLIDQRQEPIAINGMLARHARMMLQVKIGLARNMSSSDIAAKAGINPYAMKEYLEGVRNYSLPELYRFHADVYEADRSMKSRPVPSPLVLSRLLLSLCRPA